VTRNQRQKFKDVRWQDRSFRGDRFENAFFSGAVFQNASFTDCVFHDCDFKNCYIGFGTSFRRCRWERCDFIGPYSSFGGASEFTDCAFLQTLISDASMEGAVFRSCSMSGRLTSLIFYGPDCPPARPTVFSEVDMRKASFHEVDFRCAVDLSSVLLPESGVRVFRNPSGALSRGLRAAGETLTGEDRIPLVVFGAEFYDSQDPLVFDQPILSELLATAKAREVFEQIVAPYAA